MQPTLRRLSILVASCLVLGAPATPALAQSTTQAIHLEVDAREVARGLLHARLAMPSAPGPLTLVYPKWIPGEHGPTGPVKNLTGLEFSAGGSEIPWERDPADLYAFHLTVPEGVDTVAVQLDFLVPTGGEGFTAGGSATPRLAVVNWNQVLLYPAGAAADEVIFEASLQLPEEWTDATALEVASRSDTTVHYEPVTLRRLVDSPVQIARFRNDVVLEGFELPHAVRIAADSQAALELPKHFARDYARLTAEAGALFGARHYRHYEWLVTLSDEIAHFGLEHHESSDNRMGERTLLEDSERHDLTGLLAHEYLHSWNAKYRRPAGLVRKNYQKPRDTSLLWVYEGLTSYLDTILPARSGLWTPEYTREALAELAAVYSHRAGRRWRPLGDTARAARKLYGTPRAWRSRRRGVDFYGESVLVWLEADTIIQRETRGNRSLDDFYRAFFGGEGGEPARVPYTRGELVEALGSVADYDWDGFFTERIGRPAESPPIAGLEAAGWRLVFTDERNLVASEEHPKRGDWRFSLGLVVDEGDIEDVLPGLPAADAGMAPGMRIIAVNGRTFSSNRLDAVVRQAAEREAGGIELLVESGEYFQTFTVEYTGGLRYPHLERIEGTPNLLAGILAPRTWEPE